MNIIDYIHSGRKVVVISHLNPDGDAIGATVALSQILRKMGCDCVGITPNTPPENLMKINGVEQLLFYRSTPDAVAQKIAEAETIFCVDFNDIDTRIDKLGELIRANTHSVKILIDHHQSPPEGMYDMLFSDVAKSSTSLMIYEVIERIGKCDLIDRQIAEALFIGMMTDTGNFTYGNLTGELYRILGHLVDKGVRPNALYSKLFNSQTESRVRLMGFALNEKMVVIPELKCGYIALNAEELKRYNFSEGDLEGVVNIPLSIAGISNSALFLEKSSLTKISLRSLCEGIDMNQFAREHYIGGGHINAAGGKWFGSLEETVEIFTKGLAAIYKNNA